MENSFLPYVSCASFCILLIGLQGVCGLRTASTGFLHNRSLLRAETPVQVIDISADCVHHHNMKRVMGLIHGLKPVQSDLEAKKAARRAIEEVVKRDCDGFKLSESVAEGYGENSFGTDDSGDGVSCHRAVDYWYTEDSYDDYDPITMANHKDIGHFTQVMWQGSRRIGCYKTDGCHQFSKKEQIICSYHEKTPNIAGQQPFDEKIWTSVLARDATRK